MAAPSLVHRYWAHWHGGDTPDLAAFLAEIGPTTPADLAALLRVEQAERWRRGERVAAEDLLVRFPSLRADSQHALDLVYGEYLLRDGLGEAPATDEYVRRFPEFASDFLRQVEVHIALASGASLGSAAAANGPPFDVPGYELGALLGRGGMGVVYRARQTALGRPVALKFLADADLNDPEARRRFRAEAEAAAQLRHPNIVQVYEVGEVAGRPWFSMEFVEGGSLAQRLGAAPFPERTAAQLIETLANAAAAAHRCGVVHRDIKPGNVLLEIADCLGIAACSLQIADLPEREREREREPMQSAICKLQSAIPQAIPKLADFGLARRLDADDGQTRTGAIVGTPAYMAPEQAEGRGRLAGPTADVYSLGALFYELVTGRPPFVGVNVLETLEQVRGVEPVPPRRLQPRLSRDAETICLKCLAKSPAARYATATELAADLGRLREGRPILARPVGPLTRLARACRRRPLVAGLAAGLLVTLLGGLGGVFAQWRVAEARRVVATGQRDRALANLRLAREAIDRFHTRVSEERLREEPGMEGLRRELLQSAAEFYGVLAQQEADDAEAEWERGLANLRLGTLLGELGSWFEARTALERAQEILAARVDAAPGEPEPRRRLAHTYSARAAVLAEIGTFAEAVAAHRAAGKLLEALAVEDPEGEEVLRELAAHESNYGGYLNRHQKPGEALPLLSRAVDRLALLAGRHPDSARHQLVLATARLNHATTLKGADQFDAAAREIQRAAPLFERWATGPTAPAEHRYLAARAAQQLGWAYARLGRPTEAAASWRKAGERLEELVRRHPGVARYRHHLALSGYNHFNDLFQAGKYAEAAAEARRALDRLEEPGAPPREGREGDELLACLRQSLGTALARQGRTADAEAAWRQAVRDWERLGDAPPTFGIAEGTGGAAQLHYDSGYLHQSLGSMPKALEATRTGLAHAERWVEAHPEKLPFRLRRAMLRTRLGVLQVDVGQLAKSADMLQGAIEDWEWLAARDAGLFAGCSGMADARVTRARVLDALGRKREGREALAAAVVGIERGLEHGKHRSRAEVNGLRHQHFLALGVVAGFAEEDGRRTEAIEAYGRSAELGERLLAEGADLLQLASTVGWVRGERARLRYRANDPAGAIEECERCAEAYRKAVRENPVHRAALVWALVMRGELLLKAGRWPDALPVAREALPLAEGKVRTDVEVILTAAQFATGDAEEALTRLRRWECEGTLPEAKLGQLAAIAATGAALAALGKACPVTERDAVVEECASLAFDLLARARSVGPVAPAVLVSLRSNLSEPAVQATRHGPAIRRRLAEGGR